MARELTTNCLLSYLARIVPDEPVSVHSTVFTSEDGFSVATVVITGQLQLRARAAADQHIGDVPVAENGGGKPHVMRLEASQLDAAAPVRDAGAL